MNTPINKKILHAIDNQELSPKPIYYFTLKETALWIGTVCSFVLGGISLGSFIFQIFNIGIIPIHISFISIIIRILIILISISFAIYQILNTKKGYKRTRRKYIIIGFFIISIVGSLLFFTNISGKVEGRIGNVGLVTQSKAYWTQAKQGTLAGELIEINTDGYLIVNDFQDNPHIVDAENITKNNQDIFIDFLRVRMVGYERNGIFYPCAVAPWELKGLGKQKISEQETLIDGNIKYSQGKRINGKFKEYFERKDDIVRTNSCSY